MPDQQGFSQLTRRTLLKGAAALGLAAPAGSALAAGGGGGVPVRPRGQDAAGEGTRGGTLRVALYSELPTMDMPFTAANIVGAVIWNIFEPLFTFDQQFQLIPMLAESHAISDDQLTHTIKLRQGVPFHNGTEMVAADVVASLQRWGRISGFARNLMGATNEIVEVDSYTVEFRLNTPFGTLPHTLATNNGAPPIYPKSVCDAAGDEQITEFIGTGPYRFVERQADRFIRVERFEEYSALPGEPNGYGGHKYAYADRIEFIPVPDEAAQTAGLQAGDYQYLQAPRTDQYNALKDDPSVTVERTTQSDYLQMLLLNWQSPVLADVRIRQAIQARLDCESVLLAGLGEGFYRLDPGVMWQETPWHSTVNGELYNRNDPEAARALVQEAGYDGTPIRLLTIAEVRSGFNMAATIRQQLEEIGLVIDFQAVDNPTAFERWGIPDQWDMFPVGFGFKADPIQVPLFRICNPNGGWCEAETAEHGKQLSVAADFERRYAAIEQLQQDFYEDVGAVKLGDSFGVLARGKQVQGQMLHTALGITFWNMWLAD
jgi:peptide/nickel transport system substrate-binding protein